MDRCRFLGTMAQVLRGSGGSLDPQFPHHQGCGVSLEAKLGTEKTHKVASASASFQLQGSVPTPTPSL
jgi:hypothetical protein